MLLLNKIFLLGFVIAECEEYFEYFTLISLSDICYVNIFS